MKIIVTGGCGFIGHHFVEHLLKNTDWEIIVLDKLNYASMGYDRLRDINCFDEKRVRIFNSNIENRISDGISKEIGKDIDFIVHMAAETHVDRSIQNPWPFIKTNIIGTIQMLEYARTLKKLKIFLYFSTDEVFGPAPKGVFYKEWDRYNCTNPYSASKAAGEEFSLAWGNTYKLPVLVTHTMNVFGERQYPEKFIPMTIKNILSGTTVYIHSDSARKHPGSRCWIHARNVSDGVLYLINLYSSSMIYPEGIRDKFNIAGKEMDNLQVAKLIAKIIGKKLKYKLIDFHSSRPGHDLRYALANEQITQLGWKPKLSLEEALQKTIEWTLKNKKWLKL